MADPDPHREFVYPLMQPPEPFHEFGKMDEDEAERHFRWFTGNQNARVKLLRGAINTTTPNADWLDGTPSSLKPLWNWVRPQIELLAEDKLQMASGTLCLAVDIGFMLAKILQKMHPEVHWELWTKSKDYYFQRPVVVGIGRHPVVPHDPVVASFWGAIHNKASDDELTKRFDVWLKKFK